MVLDFYPPSRSRRRISDTSSSCNSNELLSGSKRGRSSLLGDATEATGMIELCDWLSIVAAGIAGSM